MNEKFEALHEIYLGRHATGDPAEDAKTAASLFEKAQADAEALATKIEHRKMYDEVTAVLIVQELYHAAAFKSETEGGR